MLIVIIIITVYIVLNYATVIQQSVQKRRLVGVPKKLKNEAETSQDTPRPSTPVGHGENDKPSSTSSSSKKFAKNIQKYEELAFKGDGSSFDIVNLDSIQGLLDQIARCAKCEGLLSISTENRVGLSVTMKVRCTECEFSVRSSNSKILTSGKAEVNARLCYAFRCIGQGEQAAKTFCGIRNLQNPSSFKYFAPIIAIATKEVAEESTKRAAEGAVEADNEVENEDDQSRDITITIDGSW